MIFHTWCFHNVSKRTWKLIAQAYWRRKINRKWKNDVLGGFPINKTAKVSFQEKNFSPGIENDRTEIGVEAPLTGGFDDSAASNARLFQDLAAGDSEDQCGELALSLIQCLFDQLKLVTRCTTEVQKLPWKFRILWWWQYKDNIIKRWLNRYARWNKVVILTHDNVDNLDNFDNINNNYSHNQPDTLGEPGKQIGRGHRPEGAAVRGFLDQSCQVFLNKQNWIKNM